MSGASVLRAALAASALLLAGCAPPPPVPAQAIADAQTLILTLDGLAVDRMARARAVAARADATLEAAWPLGVIGRDCIVLRPKAGRLAETARALAADPEVRSVQPMGRFSVLAPLPAPDSAAAGFQASAPPDLDAQPSLRALNAPRAHAVATGLGVTVALIDTAVDAAHPELRAAVAARRDFVEDGGGGGGERHGTALAGVIAAQGRLRGVAFDARLLGLRACWEEAGAERGVCSTASLARALDFAAEQGADVINLSVSGPADALLGELIDAATRRGAVVVAAADPAGDGFPASHPGVWAARAAGAASASADALPLPGTDVLTPQPGSGYDFFSGSSLAAAHLSGVAALLREVAPTMAPAAMRSAVSAAVVGRGAARRVDACLVVAPRGPCAAL